MSELRDDRRELHDEDRFDLVNEGLLKVGDWVSITKNQVDIVGMIISIDDTTVLINHKWGQCCAKIWEVEKLS